MIRWNRFRLVPRYEIEAEATEFDKGDGEFVRKGFGFLVQDLQLSIDEMSP